jgi:hypothetical protein
MKSTIPGVCLAIFVVYFWGGPLLRRVNVALPGVERNR